MKKTLKVLSLLFLIFFTFGCNLNNDINSSSSSTSSSSLSTSSSTSVISSSSTSSQITYDSSKTNVLNFNTTNLSYWKNYYENILNQNPDDIDANFNYLFISLFSFLEDQQLKSIFEDSGVVGLPESAYDIINYISFGPNMSPLKSPNFINPETLPNITTIKSVLKTNIMPKVDKLLEIIDRINSVPNLNYKINLLESFNKAFNTNISSLVLTNPEAKYILVIRNVELNLIDGLLSSFKGAVNLVCVNNFNMDFGKFKDFIDNLKFIYNNIEQYYYNPFKDPNFGTIDPEWSNGYSVAKNSFLRAIQKLKQVINTVYNNPVVPGSNEIYLAENIKQDEYNFISYILNQFEYSLNGNYVYLNYTNNTDIITTSGIKFSLGKFFDNQPTLRDLFIELDSLGEPVLYTTNDTPQKVTTPINGNIYALKLMDPTLTFKGLFETNLIYELLSKTPLGTNSEISNSIDELLRIPGYIIIPVPYTNAGYNSTFLNYIYSIYVSGLEWKESASIEDIYYTYENGKWYIYIKFSPVSWAEGYNIYRSISNENNFILLTNINKREIREFWDYKESFGGSETNWVNVYYYIEAYNNTLQSNSISITNSIAVGY